MHDPLVMRVLQGIADRRHDGQRLPRVEGFRTDQFSQVRAFDEFHDEVEQPRFVRDVRLVTADWFDLTKIVDGDDVRMIQSGQRTGFT
jgi:hypothetical protein